MQLLAVQDIAKWQVRVCTAHQARQYIAGFILSYQLDKQYFVEFQCNT